jgi:hypothetical protein
LVGQVQNDYLDGSNLYNLKKAIPNVWYVFPLDSLKSTRIMFDKNGKPIEIQFDLPELKYLQVDTIQYVDGTLICLKDINGKIVFNSVFMGKRRELFIRGYMGKHLYGKSFGYYKNGRLSLVSTYNGRGKQVGWSKKYSRNGRKGIEYYND